MWFRSRIWFRFTKLSSSFIIVNELLFKILEILIFIYRLKAEWSFLTLDFMFFNSSNTANMFMNLPSVNRYASLTNSFSFLGWQRRFISVQNAWIASFYFNVLNHLFNQGLKLRRSLLEKSSIALVYWREVPRLRQFFHIFQVCQADHYFLPFCDWFIINKVLFY